MRDSVRWHPVVLAISGYQQYISPHKGFCCAHRLLTGEPSCSEYIKRAIIAQGLLHAWGDIRQRLQACKASARQLREARSRDAEGEGEAGEGGEKGAASQHTCFACADGVACVPSCGGAEIVSGAGGMASGGCDGCACTPF